MPARDPVIVMAEGQVIAEGSFEEIRHNRDVIDAYLGGAPARQFDDAEQPGATP